MTNALAEEGWTAQVTPVDGGRVRCEACGETVEAGALEVASLSRLEGASDPADMAAVVAVTCPGCDARGLLVLTYGPEASGADADVLRALPDLPDPRDPGVTDRDTPGPA